MSEYCSRKLVYLNFLLAIGVVIGHAINIETYSLELFKGGNILLRLEQLLSLVNGGLGVATFFIISGYLFFRNFTFEMLSKKWKSRFFSLVIPFMIWNTLGYLYWFMVNHIPMPINSRVNTDGVKTFLSAVFCVQIYNGPLWFLRDLIIAVLLSPLIFVIVRKKFIGGVILIASSLVLFWVDKEPLCFASVLFYSFGGYFARHNRDATEIRWEKKNCIYALLVFVVLSAILYVFFWMLNLEMQAGIYFWTRLLRSISLWILLDLIDWDKVHVPYANGFIVLSFYIYVSHFLILETIQKSMMWVFGDSLLGALVDFFVSPCITLIIVWLSACLLRKNCWIWKTITGGRG